VAQRRAWAIVLLGALAAPTRSVAQSDAARVRAEAGRRLYELGRYVDAIREFESGYALDPRPGFLVNIGQAYRQLGDLEDARDYYRRFLAEAPPDEPPARTDRAAAAAILREIEGQLVLRQRARDAPEKPSASTPVVPTKTAVREQPAPAPPTPAEPARPARRLWWLIPVVVAVAAAGVAVGVGVWLASSASYQAMGSLATLDLRR
jgi:tetratricopeptide (TPR) repeat protein